MVYHVGHERQVSGREAPGPGRCLLPW